MRAVAIDYESRKLIATELPEPPEPAPGEVLLRIHQVGVCGTDRELARFSFGYPPPRETTLILGHEALAQIVGTGEWVVPIVRRSCTPACAQCASGRRDLCLRMATPERGIVGLHGYFRDYVIDSPAELVHVPPEIVDHAVLIEPLSVVEKALDSALRCHPAEPSRYLSIGAGSIGILAALAAQVRGLRAMVHSIEPPNHPRVKALEAAGVEYRPSLAGVEADIIVEAAGVATAVFNGLRALAPLGVLVVLGALSAQGEFPFRDLILGNRTVLGSVNASPAAFRGAVEDLVRFDPHVLERLIHRRRYSGSLDGLLETPDHAAKLVHVLAS